MASSRFGGRGLSNLRFWAAASRNIIESLASSAFETTKELQDFANELRNNIARM